MCGILSLPKKNRVRIATPSTLIYNKTDKDTAIYVVEMKTFGNWFYMAFYSAKLKKHFTTIQDLYMMGKFKEQDNTTLRSRHELYTVAIMKAILTAENTLKEEISLLIVDIHTKDMHPKEKRTFNSLKQALLEISTTGKSSSEKFYKPMDIIFIEEMFIEERYVCT